MRRGRTRPGVIKRSGGGSFGQGSKGSMERSGGGGAGWMGERMLRPSADNKKKNRFKCTNFIFFSGIKKTRPFCFHLKKSKLAFFSLSKLVIFFFKFLCYLLKMWQRHYKDVTTRITFYTHVFSFFIYIYTYIYMYIHICVWAYTYVHIYISSLNLIFVCLFFFKRIVQGTIHDLQRVTTNLRWDWSLFFFIEYPSSPLAYTESESILWRDFAYLPP